MGDEVFHASSIPRSGANAEFHLVDRRIVGPEPATLSSAAAAALPLTGIIAWEMPFDWRDIRRPVPGAADGIPIGRVGNGVAIQLVR